MPSGVYPRVSALERALARFEIAESGCWLWSGPRDQGGYARISVNSKTVLVHRLVYSKLVAPIPEGLQLDHVTARGCRYRHCINPDHLEPVTGRENVQRGKSAEPHAFCIKGHPFDAENTYVSPNGLRACRVCQKARFANARNKGTRSPKNVCKHGHPLDGPNIYVTPQGYNQCRACLRQRALRGYHRSKVKKT